MLFPADKAICMIRKGQNTFCLFHPNMKRVRKQYDTDTVYGLFSYYGIFCIYICDLKFLSAMELPDVQ